MFVGVLESLNQSERFIDRATHRQIIHCDLSENTFIINDEETSETQEKKMSCYLTGMS